MTRAAFVLGSNGPETLGRLKKLTFARDDAVRFARAISAIDVGFSIRGRTLRTRDTIIKRFDELASELDSRDELLFYFAGHGLISHGDLYLVLDQTRTGHIAGIALPWVNIKQIIRQSFAGSKVVILDCCHAGEAIDDPLGGAYRGEFDSEAINSAVRGSTASILVACGPDGFARETEKRGGGVLTSLIVDALGPKREKAADSTGRVSLQSLRDWMWKEIDNADDLASMREKPSLHALGGPTFYLTLPANYGGPTARPSRRRPSAARASTLDTEIAARQADPLALFQLGQTYLTRRTGRPEDGLKAAARLFQLAADQGNANAQVALARLYQNEHGGLPKNEREAAQLLRFAADQNNADGQLALGFCYEAGRGGLSRDRHEAVRLFRAAAENGSVDARIYLREFYYD